MRTYSWYNSNTDYSSPDAIHQILAYGGLEDIKELKNLIGIEKIKRSFLKYPKKVYRPAGLNFILNLILNLAQVIDRNKYLKDVPRNIR